MPAYPLSKAYGSFPPKVAEAIVSVVRKSGEPLRALRNVKNIKSNSMHALMRDDLERVGFTVKPRRFGTGLKDFEVDAYHEEAKVALEIEKGRAMLANQVYLDLFKFHILPEIRFGAIVLPEVSREESEQPFRKTCVILDAAYAKSPLGFDFDGILVVGY